MRKAALLFVALALVVPVVVPASDETRNSANSNARLRLSTSSLRVLIITPNPKVGYGPGIKNLLEEHNIEAELASWEHATGDFASKFDVLIVTGVARRPNIARVRLDYQKPILAYGPYGCAYLGFLHAVEKSVTVLIRYTGRTQCRQRNVQKRDAR